MKYHGTFSTGQLVGVAVSRLFGLSRCAGRLIDEPVVWQGVNEGSEVAEVAVMVMGPCKTTTTPTPTTH